MRLADHYFQEIIDIADNATPETVNVARLRVDSRKFAVARLAPKKYGNQISHDGHGGAALNFQPAILIRVTGAAEADVRSASEEADGVLLDANGDIVRER